MAEPADLDERWRVVMGDSPVRKLALLAAMAMNRSPTDRLVEMAALGLADHLGITRDELFDATVEMNAVAEEFTA